MRFEVRTATLDDDLWLFQLHENAHRKLVEAAYGPWSVEQQRDFFRPLVDEHDVFVIVADDADVGAIYLGERDGDTWLELIEVDPARQGEGIGAAALHWVASESTSHGRGTRLQVHRINHRAKRLYEREGFASIGETATHHLLRRP